MRRPGGYAVIFGEDRPDEADTFTCAHCQRITMVKARQRPEDIGGLCKVCMGLICSECVDKGCTPFERRIENFERTQDVRRWMGI